MIVEVWSVNGQEKVLIPALDQSKFYSGGCYIFQNSYPGEDREGYHIGTWFGNKSVEVNFKHPILTCTPISFWVCGAVINTLGTCHKMGLGHSRLHHWLLSWLHLFCFISHIKLWDLMLLGESECLSIKYCLFIWNFLSTNRACS